MSKLKELLEARKKAHDELTGVLNAAEQTGETRAKAAKILADIETMGNDIQNIERADKIAAEIAARGKAADGLPNADPNANLKPEEVAKRYRAAYTDMLRNGIEGQSRCLVGSGAKEESLALLAKVRRDFAACVTQEQRDQLAGTQSITYTQGASGGYFVPAGYVYDIEQATKYFAQLLDGSTVRILETATGQVLPYPTSNDTQEAWHVLGESSQIQDQGTNQNYPTVGTIPTTDAGNVSLGHVNFGAWKGSTGLIRVSLELLQDSAFALEPFLTERFAERLGRGYEAYLTQGTGSSQPTGIIPSIQASGSAIVTAAGSNANDGLGGSGANSIGYSDLVNLIHSVDPTYRRGAKFMFHDNTLAHLKTRLDKYGRPLWVPSVRESEPDTVAGYPYVINQSFPVIAPSALTIGFGQWSKFIVRKVKDLQILRLDERFADFGEVAYVGFSRLDSNLVDAGTHPLNLLQQHS